MTDLSIQPTMPVGAEDNTTGDENLIVELNTVADLNEFRPFNNLRDVLIDKVVHEEGTALTHAASNHNAELRRLQRLSKTSQYLRGWRRTAAKSLLVIALFGVVYFLISGIWDFAWLPESRPAWQSFILSGVLSGLASSLTLALQRNDRIRLAQRRADLLRDWNSERPIALSQAYRRAINNHLGPSGIAPFPAKAPDLVELSTDKIVESQTVRYVRQFIEDHSSSALGIAGPRGVGKSTIMAAIQVEPSAQVLSISAAAKYDQTDLLRRLAFAAADRFAADIPDRMHRQRRALMLGFAFYILILGGIGLIAVDLQDPAIIPKTLGSLSGLGAASMICGFFIFAAYITRARSAFNLRRVHNHGSEGHALARQLVSDLQYEVERTSGEKATFKLTNALGLESNSSRKNTTRALSYADLVDRTRAVLQQLGREATDRSSRLIVMIDELDKLPDTDSLVHAINSLKDLYHLPGVHFIVSVSDEALTSFEMRGLQARDAFDSAFDMIVRANRFTEAESRDLLDSRVAGFPPDLGRLCHVWSGGLPRDLIRAARACIEIHHTDTHAQTLASVASRFLASDFDTRFNALLKSERMKSANLSLEVRETIRRWSRAGVNAEDLKTLAANQSESRVLWAFAACCLQASALIFGTSGLDDESIQLHLSELAAAVAQLADGDLAEQDAIDVVLTTLNECGRLALSTS